MKVSSTFLLLATLLVVSTHESDNALAATLDKVKHPKADFTVPACATYFESAVWRFDDGPKLWSLSLVPTRCTRSLKGAKSSTGLVIDAVIRDHSGDRYWKDGNNTRGMRDQIICHLAELSGKAEWNVEPGRPDVGYTETVRRKCNP